MWTHMGPYGPSGHQCLIYSHKFAPIPIGFHVFVHSLKRSTFRRHLTSLCPYFSISIAPDVLLGPSLSEGQDGKSLRLPSRNGLTAEVRGGMVGQYSLGTSLTEKIDVMTSR